MTKHPYLKEIGKTTLKIALIGGITLMAIPYVFGFAATLFNMMSAGYVAGYATALMGAYGIIKTTAKDILNIRKKVKQQQHEEHMNEELENLKKEIQKTKEPNQELKEIQKEKEIKLPGKLISKKQKMTSFFTKKKTAGNYRDAA